MNSSRGRASQFDLQLIRRESLSVIYGGTCRSCPDSSKCVASGAASVSPLDLQHRDVRPLTNVVEHVLVMLTMNYRCPPSSHSVWSDNVSRGRQRR